MKYGGPDGELAASLRYLNQRYTMPNNKTKALLTDIGTEELAHMEMVAAMVYQLIKDATPQQIKDAGMDTYYVDRGKDLFYVDANGNTIGCNGVMECNDGTTMEVDGSNYSAITAYYKNVVVK